MEGTAISRRRAYVYLAAAAAHLGFVTLGGFQLSLSRDDLVSSAVSDYGVLTGANSGYAFFAPGVSSALRATFEITDASGKKIPDRLETGVSREADLRIGNIIEAFIRGPEALRRPLAASCAGKMFGKHPGARSVVVRVETYDLPSMAEYREGQRSDWRLYYQAKLLPRSALASDTGAKGVTP